MATDINTTVPSSRLAQAQAPVSSRPEITRYNPQSPSSSSTSSVPPQAKTTQQSIAADFDTGRTAEELEEFQERLKDAVSSINQYAQNIQRSLQFSISESDGRTVIKVINSETNEIIRQIPPDEAIGISERLGQTGNGGLLIQAEV